MANNSKFTVYLYENEYNYLQWLVLQKKFIETGGDLFGVWHNEVSAVVQFVLGPGKQCQRTATAFYQDVSYLENVGRYLTKQQGLCNIGEWHSHHRLGLARPSDGDQNTVWSHMPTISGGRFLLFIANIQEIGCWSWVDVGCFMFNNATGRMTEGKMELLRNCSPLRHSFTVKPHLNLEAEQGQDWNTFCMSKINRAWRLRTRNQVEQAELEWLVLQKPAIETGGDLFGLWQNENTAFVQYVLGPGKECRRTTTSFHQDVEYLQEVGNYSTKTLGLCNIGEWHSHHAMGLAEPSGGDQATVWNHMPSVAGGRFLVFIANIRGTPPKVNVGCFLFNSSKKKILRGKFQFLPSTSPLRKTIENMTCLTSRPEEKQDWKTFNLSLRQESGCKRCCSKMCNMFCCVKHVDELETSEEDDKMHDSYDGNKPFVSDESENQECCCEGCCRKIWNTIFGMLVCIKNFFRQRICCCC